MFVVYFLCRKVIKIRKYMKKTFKEFIEENKSFSGFENDLVAKYVFDNILSRDENLISMIECNEAGEPALCGCLNEVEKYCGINNSTQFNLLNDLSKQALGRMVRTVLLPFGYESKSQKKIPIKYNAKFVKSAMTYSKTQSASLKIVKTIVEA